MSIRKAVGTIICAAIAVSSCGPDTSDHSSNKESTLYKWAHDDRTGNDTNAPATSTASLDKAEKNLSVALKDPTKVALLECMGVKVYEDPQPPGHPPSPEACKKLKDSVSAKPTEDPQPTQIAAYQMSNIERFELDRSAALKNFALAHAAAQCGLRSDGWLQAFNDAFALATDADIKHYRLTDQEVSVANDTEQRVMADAISQTVCSELVNSPTMDKLDSIRRKITGGYH